VWAGSPCLPVMQLAAGSVWPVAHLMLCQLLVAAKGAGLHVCSGIWSFGIGQQRWYSQAATCLLQACFTSQPPWVHGCADPGTEPGCVSVRLPIARTCALNYPPWSTIIQVGGSRAQRCAKPGCSFKQHVASALSMVCRVMCVFCPCPVALPLKSRTGAAMVYFEPF
jgi:hypothetical protein